MTRSTSARPYCPSWPRHTGARWVLERALFSCSTCCVDDAAEISRRSAGEMAEGCDVDSGVFAHPGRLGTAELGVDVQRMGVCLVAGVAQRPPADVLEQRVLDVLSDQPGDILLALLPLRGPPTKPRQAAPRPGEGGGGGGAR